MKVNKHGTAVLYSTYLAGPPSPIGTKTSAADIAVDTTGHAYVTGYTTSSEFPTTPGAHQRTHAGGRETRADVFVTKLSPAGDALAYSTFLGGSEDEFWWNGAIAVDISGNAYVVGDTTSPDFPVTAGALDTTFDGARTGFAVKLNGTGGAIFATYLTGIGQAASGVAVDPAGHAYVTGLIVDGLATTPSAMQPEAGGMWDAYVAKINPSGSAFVYATYLGSPDFEVGADVAVDPYGRAYVTGWTNAARTFPVSADAFQRQNAGQPGAKTGF